MTKKPSLRAAIREYIRILNAGAKFNVGSVRAYTHYNEYWNETTLTDASILFTIRWLAKHEGWVRFDEESEHWVKVYAKAESPKKVPKTNRVRVHRIPKVSVGTGPVNYALTHKTISMFNYMCLQWLRNVCTDKPLIGELNRRLSLNKAKRSH